MIIAGRNIQRELSDVNNLWKYPDEYYNPGWTMGEKLIPIKYWKIMCFSSAGPGGAAADTTGSFSTCSISGKYAGGYVCSVFLELTPGKYVISFNSEYSRDCKMWFNQYVIRNNCALYDGKGNSFSTIFHVGFNEFEFQVLNGCVAMMQFKDSLGRSDWVTLTNIKIREGEL